MPAYKDKKRGTWGIRFKQKNWKGEVHEVCKYGFATKHEALKWEDETRRTKEGSLDMTLGSFVEDIYLNDLSRRVKQSTLAMKRNIINAHIIPFFGERKIDEITSKDVICWQNEIMDMKIRDGRSRFKDSYLRTIHTQLSCILAYAVRYYDLPKNPAHVVGSMGRNASTTEMKFWTLAQYRKFADAMMDEPMYYYCFEILYWCGLREGEMLALTLEDFNFEAKTVSVTKTYSVLNGKPVVTSPKTRQSIRVVTMPSFLNDEIQDYIRLVYKPGPTDRIFLASKSMLGRAMERGSSKAGIEPIRIHDLRHPYVKLTT